MRPLLIALRTAAFTLALTGLAYPLAITGLAQVLFPRQANGSLVKDERGRVVGSELLAQRFSRPEYFQPRPSAAGEGYDALASGGSNLGPTSQQLKDRVTAEVARLRRENPGQSAHDVPDELVTTSASGLDPHLSRVAVDWQLERVATRRGVSTERLRALVERQAEGRDLGVLGEPRINVLLLNLAMDEQFGRVPEAGR